MQRELRPLRLGALAVTAALAWPAPPAGAKPRPPKVESTTPSAPRVELGEAKAKLTVLSDGQGHYVVLMPFGSHDHTYYGDGKSFFALRVGSSSSVGTEAFDFTFWEPRVKARYQASVQFRDGAYSLQCGDRKTAFAPLPAAEADALLAAAAFFGPRWPYEAYALARDDRGTYYYVDHQREPEGNLAFRVYRGPRGKLKPLKMVNVVSDSEGEIFATRAGDLRLVLDKKETSWVAGQRSTKLVSLDLYENVMLIYTDLGPYLGERLGTPCDDL
ncbi:MAG: hypothetical protein KA712_11845 [Myxococcales bacterium]|nr:hypothetical protein [Myxococcales bacterium]